MGIDGQSFPTVIFPVRATEHSHAASIPTHKPRDLPSLQPGSFFCSPKANLDPTKKDEWPKAFALQKNVTPTLKYQIMMFREMTITLPNIR